MDTAVVVLVLILVLGLFGCISWLFVREVGWNRARAMVVSPLVDATSSLPTGSTTRAIELERSEMLSQLAAQTEEALRTLREELLGEVTRSSGLTREMDARITVLESTLSEQSPTELARSMQDLDARQQRVADQLHRELGMVQRTASSYGERRVTAVAELYSHLARVEAALAAVVNPALLPGEPLSLPTELGRDAFVWSHWHEVGERSFSFGDVFNQHRFVLDDDTAGSIEHFISTLRRALTSSIYPNVQQPNPNAVQRSHVSTGLGQIVAALPEIRRKLEAAYRAETIDSSSLEQGA